MILSSMVTFLQGYHGQIPVVIGPTIQWILKYLLPFFLTYCMFVLIYRIIPSKKVHFTSALQAALFTACSGNWPNIFSAGISSISPGTLFFMAH